MALNHSLSINSTGTPKKADPEAEILQVCEEREGRGRGEGGEREGRGRGEGGDREGRGRAEGGQREREERGRG